MAANSGRLEVDPHRTGDWRPEVRRPEHQRLHQHSQRLVHALPGWPVRRRGAMLGARPPPKVGRAGGRVTARSGAVVHAATNRSLPFRQARRPGAHAAGAGYADAQGRVAVPVHRQGRRPGSTFDMLTGKAIFGRDAKMAGMRSRSSFIRRCTARRSRPSTPRRPSR